MPRPSKPISPDTLGGRIRAARKRLQLSLADVADGHYSTSLISQIERNRADPSQESLRFLAHRLELPLEDLQKLALQHRATEFDAHHYTSYEQLRQNVTTRLAQKDISGALHLLQDVCFSQIPPTQRWHLAALRGQCYFELRQFLKAQLDFVYAMTGIPDGESHSPEQKQELMLLHLHLAGTYRELQQLDAALEHYKTTLQMINSGTPFGYVAEAHWGISLITYAQANRLPTTLETTRATKNQTLRVALEHAEIARYLYRSIGEQLRATSVTCQIAQIEQALGEVNQVRLHLEEVLATCDELLANTTTTPTGTSTTTTTSIDIDKKQYQEITGIISSTSCAMANLELEAGHYQQARAYVERALISAQSSYKLRRADAYIMLGRVLEALDPFDPAATEAFRQATEELATTQRIAARISAHVRFGHHLLKTGKMEEGEQELEQARLLSDLVSASSDTSSVTDDPHPA
jgi:tetratricopeptide (TPR) repeat protein